jgi:hypothetical protein
MLQSLDELKFYKRSLRALDAIEAGLIEIGFSGIKKLPDSDQQRRPNLRISLTQACPTVQAS